MGLRTKDLLTALPQWTAIGELPDIVGGVVGDSRKVGSGDVFVAIHGLVDDGHRYVAQARHRGAALVVGEDEAALTGGPSVYVPSSRVALGLLAAAAAGHPSREMRVIGVTGTNGKTTTTHLVAAALEAAGLRCAIVGTVGALFDGKRQAAARTTPPADELQVLLKELKDQGARAVAMEVSSHALDLHRHVGTEFDGAVFTNLTQDHLDYHGTLERYLEAKLRLFEALANSTKRGPRWAVVNADDPAADKFIAKARAVGAETLTYGLDAGDVRAEAVSLRPDGASFTAITPVGSEPVTIRLTGKFNVMNALAAISAAVAEGSSLGRAASGISAVQGVPGRVEAVRMGQPFEVVVDYAHTPDGLKNVLEAAREVTRGRVLVVFGAGGDRDRGKRPLMGKAVAELADYAFLTSDNPRTEDPERILDDVEAGFRAAGGHGERWTDRRQAIRRALREARPRDLVVIAGKGHEETQVIGGRILPFDDRKVAAEELAALAPW